MFFFNGSVYRLIKLLLSITNLNSRVSKDKLDLMTYQLSQTMLEFFLGGFGSDFHDLRLQGSVPRPYDMGHWINLTSRAVRYGLRFSGQLLV